MKTTAILRLIGLCMLLVFSISGITAQTPTTTPIDTTPAAVDTTPTAAPATTTTTTTPEETKKEKDGFNSKTRFGIRGGGIMSKTEFENSDDPTADPESKIGADLAILCAIPIGGGFFMLQPELHWLQKGYKIEDINTGDNVISTLNYLELPLLLRLNLGGSIRVFAFAGPSVGYLLDGELNTSAESLDATEYLDQIEYNGHIGLGVGLGTFEIDVRYIAGLSDISDAENLEEVRNSSFGAGITLKF